MRIALYHSVPLGGAKRIIFDQVKRLNTEHEITLYSLNNLENQFCDLRPIVKESFFFPFIPTGLFQSPFGRINQAIRSYDLYRLKNLSKIIANHINRIKYDVAYVHPCQFTGTPWLLQFLNVPSVNYCQEYNRFLHEKIQSRPYFYTSSWKYFLDDIDIFSRYYRFNLRSIERNGLKHANCILVNSQFIRQEIDRLYKLNASVCYLGIDSDLFTNLRQKKHNIVLSVGMLTPSKGFDFIIEGLSHIPDHHRPTLLIVSARQQPDERNYLVQLANTHKVRLRILSTVDNTTLVKIYNQAKLTIYTPYREPFGLVPLESMACGTPVIGIDEGGIKETIQDGITGRLVSRDPTELASKTLELILQPELISNMGRAGRDYILQEWTWDKRIKLLEYYLDKAANEKAKTWN